MRARMLHGMRELSHAKRTACCANNRADEADGEGLHALEIQYKLAELELIALVYQQKYESLRRRLSKRPELPPGTWQCPTVLDLVASELEQGHATVEQLLPSHVKYLLDPQHRTQRE